MANRGINKVILIGYLGQDPEVRYMTNGNIVVSISIATTESWKDKQTNEFKEKTEWHKVVLFGKVAEIASEYLRKGSQVYIEGALRTRKWKNQDGQDRYMTEIIVGIGGIMQILNNRYSEDKVLSSDESGIGNNDTHSIQSSNDDLKDASITTTNFDEDDIPF